MGTSQEITDHLFHKLIKDSKAIEWLSIFSAEAIADELAGGLDDDRSKMPPTSQITSLVLYWAYYQIDWDQLGEHLREHFDQLLTSAELEKQK